MVGGPDCERFAMRLVVIAMVALIFAVATSVRPSTAQSQFGNSAYSSDRSSSLQMADNSASLRRELARARAQERDFGCRRLFFRSRSGTCRNIQGRIGALQRQLRGGEATAASYRTLRTICVRVCDGYYYTMSHTSSRKRISQDAEKCAGQYPPGEAVLFYHPFPSDDVRGARTLDGKRYADQEYAFVFRSAFKPQCAARLHKGLAALKARVFAAVPTLLDQQSGIPADDGIATDVVPLALARPIRSSDPETLANRAGGLVPRPINPSIADALRVVGDPYYFVEKRPGPPPTVPGYVPPELKDFRVKQQASAFDATRRTRGGRTRDVPSGGPY